MGTSWEKRRVDCSYNMDCHIPNMKQKACPPLDSSELSRIYGIPTLNKGTIFRHQAYLGIVRLLSGEYQCKPQLSHKGLIWPLRSQLGNDYGRM